MMSSHSGYFELDRGNVGGSNSSSSSSELFPGVPDSRSAARASSAEPSGVCGPLEDKLYKKVEYRWPIHKRPHKNAKRD